MDQTVEKYKQKSLHKFDSIADNYNDSWDGKWSALMYHSVMEKVDQEPFASILDVGCGTGAMLSMVLNQYPSVQACGLDFSPKMLDIASESLSNRAELIHGDADDLPWPADSFDIVICSSSFHHYPEPLRVLSEMKRVLKTKGKLIMADPWWPDMTRFLINVYLRTPFNLAGDVKIYSRQELIKLLHRGGFNNISWEKPSQKYCIACAHANK